MTTQQKKKYGKRSLGIGDLKFISDVVQKVLKIDGIEKKEIPDIEHELVLVLLKRIRRFNQGINTWKSFRAIVVQHALTDIVRKHTGPDSDFNRMAEFSLDDPVPGSRRNNPVFFRDLVNEDGFFTDGTEKGQRDRLDLIMDVRNAIASMPKHLQGLCYAVMEGESKKDLSKRFKVSRPTIDFRLLEIKKVMISHGIDGRF